MHRQLSMIVGVIALVGTTLSGAVQAEVTGAFEVEARVIKFSERYGTVKEIRPVKECREVQVRSGGGSTDSDTPELLGAILGGAIGKEIDDDSKSSTVIGALLGASIGSDLEDNAKKNKGEVRTEVRCTTVETAIETQRLIGYDVAYEYQGYLFRSTTTKRPGSTIKVKIYAIPIDEAL